MVSKVQQNILNMPPCPDPPHLRSPQEFHQCSLCLPYPQSEICVSANKTTGELGQSVCFLTNEYLICHSPVFCWMLLPGNTARAVFERVVARRAGAELFSICLWIVLLSVATFTWSETPLDTLRYPCQNSSRAGAVFLSDWWCGLQSMRWRRLRFVLRRRLWEPLCFQSAHALEVFV